MAEERNFVELRSEEVQEILGTPPGWLVRRGTLVLLIGFICLIAVASFLRYPDVVSSDKLSLTTADPPVEVVARSDGRIAYLLVPDTSIVVEKQPLAVLQNTAFYVDVVRLDTLVRYWQKLPLEQFETLQYPDSLKLGELQSDYAVFIRDLADFQFGNANRNSSVQSNIGSIQMQINQLEQSIQFDRRALKRADDQYKIAEDLFERQKKLFNQGIISEAKLEEERLKLANVERERDLLETNVLSKNREIINLKNSIQNASFGQEETASTSTTRLMASLNGLRSGLDRWFLNNVLSAPIAGKVVLNGLTVQQYIRNGETVMTIVPQSLDKIVGRVSLPVEKSGKVSVGQAVMIKLDNYPYQEYGTLAGKVASKSAVPKNREYTILIDHLDMSKTGKLLTSSGREILFEQQLLGTADIITENKGFLERILDQVKVGMR
ncbi:MAG: HlyD family efflux transporter periplasmic adaptor subunit [Saprospiraceae bacterium]|nr:HlyD family efflux transporter periplasmic adaptor subunit [Saprospiraceae bacterium]